MSTFYTDQLSGVYDSTPDAMYLAPYGCDVETRTKRCRITLPISVESVVESGDKIIVAKVNSGDRMSGLWLSADGNVPATSTIAIGLQLITAGGGIGADLDIDLFEDSVALSAASDRAEMFTTAVLDDWDRGKPMWELASIGAASYTEDPHLDWWIIAEFTSDPAAITTASELQFELAFDMTN